jgi:succinate dehydrogenase/fumarate reductase-like Fe-S protein
MSGVAILRIKRGAAGEAQQEVAYEVPFEPGQSVLDALRWIRAHRDPTLAIRYSCTSANTCKECMVEVDGKTVYACTARLEARPMRIAPLHNKALIRDLVAEIAPPDERLQLDD